MLLLVSAAALAATAGAQRTLSTTFFGINNGAVEIRKFSLTDQRVQAVTAAQGAGAFRYPTGTGSGYWDWRKACISGDASCGKVNNTVEALAAYVAATGVEPIIAANMLTDTLASQLEFLAAIESAGVPVTRVELGNEFYLNNADYLKAFPTAAGYGAAASQWIAAIKAAHPGAAIAAIAAPVKPGNPSPREQTWNAGVFSKLVGADAVTMHEYTDSQVPPGVFEAADVPAFLGAPFYWVNAIAGATAQLPAGLAVWITEYNMKDPQVTGVCGTWAHGLYLATEAVLLAPNAAARVALMVPWEFLGDASMGGIFAAANGFNFSGSPDPTLPTIPFDRTAAGFTLCAFALASHGRTAAAALSFKDNPPAHGANGLVYDTIIGVFFSGGAPTDAAVVLNLGNASYGLSLGGFGVLHRYETVWAPPMKPVNSDGAVSAVNGSLPTSGLLQLPPFSISVLV